MVRSDVPVRVFILALDGFVQYDLAVAYQMFFVATKEVGYPTYELGFMGPADKAVSDSFVIQNLVSLDALQPEDTLIVPGLYAPLQYHDEKVLSAIKCAYLNGTRIASICNGATLLAKAGVLANKRATSHWDMLDDLKKQYADIEFCDNRLFVDEGQVLTSAGQDLCLYLIQRDFGAALAQRVAQRFVLPFERRAEHPQLFRAIKGGEKDGIQDIQLWIASNYSRELSFGDISEFACQSERTLARNFKKYVGCSPMEWLRLIRVNNAKILLEKTNLHIAEISNLCGFGTTVNFRIAFKRLSGFTPKEWREKYKI